MPQPKDKKDAQEKADKARYNQLIHGYNPNDQKYLDLKNDVLFDSVATSESIGVIKLLINNKAFNFSPSKQDNLGLTPFILAAFLGNKDIVKYFLSIMSPAEKAMFDYEGKTVLHSLVESPKSIEDVVQLLLSDPGIKKLSNVKDYYGQTPLELAIAKGNDLLIKLLSSNPVANPELLKDYKLDKNYNQGHIIEKLKKYLAVIGHPERGKQLISEKGQCHGLSFLYQLYSDKGSPDDYYKVLDLLLNWSGKNESAGAQPGLSSLLKDSVFKILIKSW